MNRSFSRVLLAITTTLIAVLGFTSMAAAVPDRAPVPPPTNYWQDKGFILMAHQGGEWDFPPNTLFSYKSAMAAGADMIDMDAYVTKDNQLVLTHDLDARKNSNLTDEDFDGAHDINDLTLAQLKTLDFAYKWSPHDGSSVTPYKGIATSTGSANPPPVGFTRDDFRIPTFGEVLDAFPNTPINIELKSVPGVDIPTTVNTMAGILASHPGHDENVIINSFGQPMLDAMAAARPEHKAYSGSQSGLLAYITGSPITPTPVALEPPDQYNLSGTWVHTVPILKPNADYDGYRIFVWGSDHDPAQDTDPFYANLINEGADSYNTPSPLTLAKYLCDNGIADMNGQPRCPGQVCPEGQTGIAPNNCVDIPVVPDSKVSKIKFSKKKGKVKAGKKARLVLKVTATEGSVTSVKIRLKSSNRRVKVKKTATVKLKPGATVKKIITIKAAKRARGKAKIKASSSGSSASASYKVNPLHQPKGTTGNNPLAT